MEKFMTAAYLAPPPENWDAHRTPDYRNPDFINDEQYGYLRDGGFTHAVALYEYGKENAFRALRMAEKYGIGYFVRDWDLYGTNLPPDQFAKHKQDIREYMRYPSFAGLFIDDEPSASRFDNLGKLKFVYDRITGGKDFFVNLLPTYANPTEQLGTETYRQYVEQYVVKVNPGYVMFDHYPFMCDEKRNLFLSPDYLFNLEVVAETCLKYGIPFRSFVQSTAFGPLPRDIDGDDIAWQIYVNLAFGSSGILYFTYWTMMEEHRSESVTNKDFQRDAIISRGGRLTPKYHACKRVHAEMRALEEDFFRYRWQGVMTVVGKRTNYQNIAFQNLENVLAGTEEIERVDSDYDAIIGVFSGENGRRAYMVVPYADPKEKLENRISVKFRNRSLMYVTRAGNKVGERLKDGTLELRLGCGEGVFLTSGY